MGADFDILALFAPILAEARRTAERAAVVLAQANALLAEERRERIEAQANTVRLAQEVEPLRARLLLLAGEVAERQGGYAQ